MPNLPFSRKTLSLISLLAFAQTSFAMPAPLAPRIIGQASANGSLFSDADVMIPLITNNQGFFYGDLSGSTGGYKGWMASAGAGYRQKWHDSWIAGIYGFADRNYSQYGNNFWVLNPGAEIFNDQWDFHLNAYVPNNRSRAIGTTYGNTSFSGHTQYNDLLQIYDDNGKGADFIVGRTFSSLNSTRIYGSGYYYSYQHTSPMPGVQIGLETPLSHGATLIVSNSYDKVNYDQISIGLRFTWGDKPSNDKKSIDDFMLNPIDRHMGTLDTGAGNPSQKVYKAVRTDVTRNNIWFFNPNGGIAYDAAQGTNNCTFEHPCTGSSFNQSTINSINSIASNPNLYVNSGTIDFTGSLIELPNGVNLYGRQNNFKTAGSGTSRPLFNGTFQLDGNNNLNDFRVEGADISIFGFTNYARAFISRSTASGAINFTNIDASASSSTRGALTVDLLSNSAITIQNSTFTATSSKSNDFAIALSIDSPQNITINTSTFTSNYTGTSGYAESVIFRNNASVTIDDSTINATNTNGYTGAASNSTIGIYMQDNATLVMSNSVVNTSQSGGTAASAGIKSTSTLASTINNSTFNINASQPTQTAYAANTTIGNPAITFNNSTITVTNTSGPAALDQGVASTLNSTTATCNGVAC